jgi:hypothetical protein
MIVKGTAVSSSNGNYLGEFWAFGQNLPKLLEPFFVLLSLTSFNHARFQIVAKFLSESEFFLLAPLLILQMRSQTNAFSNK